MHFLYVQDFYFVTYLVEPNIACIVRVTRINDAKAHCHISIVVYIKGQQENIFDQY